MSAFLQRSVHEVPAVISPKRRSAHVPRLLRLHQAGTCPCEVSGVVEAERPCVWCLCDSPSSGLPMHTCPSQHVLVGMINCTVSLLIRSFTRCHTHPQQPPHLYPLVTLSFSHSECLGLCHGTCSTFHMWVQPDPLRLSPARLLASA